MLIYVAGPLSGKDKTIGKLSNVIRAIKVGEQLYQMGHMAYIPHLTVFQHRIIKRLYPQYKPTYERWLQYDFELIRRCDALFRISGESPGADKEVAYARKINKPVYNKLEDVPELKKARELGMPVDYETKGGTANAG